MKRRVSRLLKAAPLRLRCPPAATRRAYLVGADESEHTLAAGQDAVDYGYARHDRGARLVLTDAGRAALQEIGK